MDRERKRNPYWHIRTALIAFVALILAGTIGYVIIERLDVLDALYMTVITISTVGYREIGELSRGGELFTMILIIGGLASVVYVTTSIVELLIEGRLMDMMGRRRVLRELQDITGHYIVCGFGRVGRQVATECRAQGTGVVVIEEEPGVVEAGLKDGFVMVTGNATEESVLREAGLERSAGLVTALSSDADNLFVTMTARIIRPDVFIVGRCNSVETESKLYRAGADRAVSPHNVGGRHMAALLLKPLVCDFIDVVTHGELVELTLDDIYVERGAAVAGRSIKDILVGDLKGIAILGLKRPKQDFNTNPRGDDVINEGDILIVTGAPDQVQHLKSVCKSKR